MPLKSGKPLLTLLLCYVICRCCSTPTARSFTAKTAAVTCSAPSKAEWCVAYLSHWAATPCVACCAPSLRTTVRSDDDDATKTNARYGTTGDDRSSAAAHVGPTGPEQSEWGDQLLFEPAMLLASFSGEHGDGKFKTRCRRDPWSLTDVLHTLVTACVCSLLDLNNTNQRHCTNRICVAAFRLHLCRIILRTSAG